ncbi:MAG: SAM-dependent methyltransferase, partial [Bacteroidia bacterium]|nr:SAM-dependent methyltransferase [Bacteroidia bacterium]
MNARPSIESFSDTASEYAKYRTGYPVELIRFVLAYTPGRQLAWDCGTGNGQTASMLAPRFGKV